MRTIFFVALLTMALSCSSSRSYGTNYPFPQSINYPFGIKPNVETQKEMNSVVSAAYKDWISRYLTSESCPEGTIRIHMGKAYDYATVSEAIGWGMLITIFMDNDTNDTRKYFDSLYKYYESHLDEYGLMNWKINRNGSVEESNSATEADENVAMALFFAHKQWGSGGPVNYLEEAKLLTNKIVRSEIEKTNYAVNPGDKWQGTDIINPCYFDPAYYKIWMKQAKNNNWQKVIDKSYSVLRFFYENYSTGLAPDWCKKDGAKAPGFSYSFKYDACQIPLKIAMDYVWFGVKNNSLAHDLPDRMTDWIKKETKGDPSKIKDGYELDGKTIGKYHNAAFVGPFAAAAMVDKKHRDWLNKIYLHLCRMPTGGDWGYYQDTLRLVSLLMLTGNMPNLYDTGKPFTKYFNFRTRVSGVPK